MSKVIGERRNRKKRKSFNWFIVAIGLFMFMVGIVAGILIGVDYTLTKMAESIGVITQGSIINVSVDLNETQIVDRSYKYLNPYLEEWNRTIIENKTRYNNATYFCDDISGDGLTKLDCWKAR